MKATRLGQQEPSGEQLLLEQGRNWLRTMIRIRAFEESLAELFRRGQIIGAVHLSIGQEAAAAGVASARKVGDRVTLSHRGHHHMLAWGLDPERMFAEILGRKSGYCRGKGGSMHVAHTAAGVFGANGIVGGGIPIAFGLALAAQLNKSDAVGVAIFGDGAANQGNFHETLNMASVWSSPLLMICENNGYTEFTPTNSVTAGPGIYTRAAAYGVPGVQIDGDDVLAVHIGAKQAFQRARRGEGPTLLELRTNRWHPHHEGDEVYAGKYRDAVEVRDPIDRLLDHLSNAGVDSYQERHDLVEEEKRIIEAALAGALQADIPDGATAYEDVFA